MREYYVDSTSIGLIGCGDSYNTAPADSYLGEDPPQPSIQLTAVCCEWVKCTVKMSCIDFDANVDCHGCPEQPLTIVFYYTCTEEGGCTMNKMSPEDLGLGWDTYLCE